MRPSSGGARAEQRLEQRRLAGAVRPDERDVLASLEHERGAVEEQLVARRDDEVVRLEHDPPGTRRPEELEAERPTLARQRLELTWAALALLLEAADLGQLRLRLLRLRLLVAEPLHEPVEPLDVVAHAVELGRSGRGARRLLTAPGVPGSVEEERLRPAELEHRRRDGLEKPPVVRDEHDRCVERGQLALEPLEALDVEVVRRLVQQQQVGIGRERARERGAGELAAREGIEGSIEVGVAEPEAAQDRRRAVAPGPASSVLEPRLSLAVATQRRGCVVAGRHRLLEPRQLLLDRHEVARTREGVLAQRQALTARRSLVVQRDARVLRERKLATLKRRLADEGPEERRLARAVRPRERKPVAPAQPERDPVEEGISRELLAETGRDQDGHTRRKAENRPVRCGSHSSDPFPADERERDERVTARCSSCSGW